MDDLDHDPVDGDAGGITPGPDLRAALEAAVAAAEPGEEGEAAEAGPAVVRARWIGQPVWNPEQGVIGYGDPIEVTEEQLEDEATPAIAWDDGWAPDPDQAAMAAAALGEGPDDREEA